VIGGIQNVDHKKDLVFFLIIVYKYTRKRTFYIDYHKGFAMSIAFENKKPPKFGGLKKCTKKCVKKWQDAL
jgi:hypothetical protein